MKTMEYIDPREYVVDVNGEEVSFGFNGISKLVLFGGSLQVDFGKKKTLNEIKQDIVENYDKYEEEDLLAFYRANGFYD